MSPRASLFFLTLLTAVCGRAETKLTLGKQSLTAPLDPISVTVPAGERVVINFPVLSGNIWVKNDVIIPDLDGRTLVIDSAQLSDAGTYRVMYIGIHPIDSQELVLKVVSTAAPAPAARFLTFSTRATAGAGNQALVSGFVVGDVPGDPSASKKVLVRAVGPTLSEFGVAGALLAPRLTVYDHDGQLCTPVALSFAELQQQSENAGAFPLRPSSGDAVQFFRLAPGSYTAQVTCGPTALPGVVMLEVYDVP